MLLILTLSVYQDFLIILEPLLKKSRIGSNTQPHNGTKRKNERKETEKTKRPVKRRIKREKKNTNERKNKKEQK